MLKSRFSPRNFSRARVNSGAVLAPRNFAHAHDVLGVPKARWLHVAQSQFHDIAPARAFGLATVWVNRRAGKHGAGATVPSSATPDLEVRSLQQFVGTVEASS